ncbi:hypothetical protein ACFE04_006723 [Oxalis oulophora]
MRKLELLVKDRIDRTIEKGEIMRKLELLVKDRIDRTIEKGNSHLMMIAIEKGNSHLMMISYLIIIRDFRVLTSKVNALSLGIMRKLELLVKEQIVRLRKEILSMRKLELLVKDQIVRLRREILS